MDTTRNNQSAQSLAPTPATMNADAELRRQAELDAEAEGAAMAGSANMRPSMPRMHHMNAAAAAGAAALSAAATLCSTEAATPDQIAAAEAAYMRATIARLHHTHRAAFADDSDEAVENGSDSHVQPVPCAPFSSPHPADSSATPHIPVRVVGVDAYGLDPNASRAEIEARLEAMDQARKWEKRQREREAQEAKAQAAMQHQQQHNNVCQQPQASTSNGAGSTAPAAPAPSNDTAAVTTAPTTSPARSSSPAADRQVLELLSLRKLQLLRHHLECDNHPVPVLPSTLCNNDGTSTNGNSTRCMGGLYLGSVGAAHHLPHLLQHGITHIVSVGRNLTQPFTQHFTYMYIPMLDSSTTRITREVYESAWKFIDMARRGTDGIDEHTPTNGESKPSSNTGEAVSPITPSPSPSVSPCSCLSSPSPSSSSPSPRRRPGNVLIHCFAGKSRSTTILLSYVMYANQWTLDQAFAHVKKCRPTINPNPGFLLQLRELEQQLQREMQQAAATAAAAASASTAAAAQSQAQSNGMTRVSTSSTPSSQPQSHLNHTRSTVAQVTETLATSSLGTTNTSRTTVN